VAFEEKEQVQTVNASNYNIPHNGKSVAQTDTVKLDVSQAAATTQTPTE